MKDNKNKSFFNRYVKLAIFLVLLVVSFVLTIYFGKAATADDNKFKVDNVSISAILDGLANFDQTEGAGNDISSSNGIVRTFDGIQYTVSYKFGIKNNSTLSTSATTRTVVVDVLFDRVIDGTVKFNNSAVALTPIFGTYSYAEFTINQSISTENNTITITVDDIYGSNDTEITPRIFIKESTDLDSAKYLSELTDQEKAGSIPAAYARTTGHDSSITSLKTKITAKDDFVINLFEGGFTKNDSTNTKDYKLGYMVGLKSESTKGIKGKHIPSTLTFNINSSATPNNSTNISFNDTINQVITDDLYMGSSDTTNKLVTVPSTTGLQNGTFDGITAENGSISIKIKDIKNYHVSLSSNNYVAFSTGMLIMQSQRQSQSDDININLAVSTSATGSSSNTLSLEDKHTRYMGSFKSKIDLYEGNSTENDTPKAYGKAIYNYGDSFIVNNQISYGTTGGGDELESLTQYIKLDNDAFKLQTLGEQGQNVLDAKFNYRDGALIDGNVTYYYGEWNSTYFKIKAGAPSGCPSSLPTSKEEIMNLYGGPCIEGTSSLKPSTDFITTHSDQIDDSLVTKGPLIIKVEFKDTDRKVINESGYIRLKAKVKDNNVLVNNSYQIVTSATAEFKNTDDSISSYYLGNETNNPSSAEAIMKNPNNYTKTIYNPTAQAPERMHGNTCNPSDASNYCAVNGNTIVVAAVETVKPTVSTSYNGTPKTDFLYYPVEWTIDVTPSLPTDSAGNTKLEESTVDVYIPNYFIYAGSELKYVYNSDGQSSSVSKPISLSNPSGEAGDSFPATELASVTTDSLANYKKYSFKLERLYEDKIQSYTIKLLTNIRLDTPNNQLVKGYFVDSNKVSTTVIENSMAVTKYYNTLEPISDRATSAEITIHNSASVTTQGDIITKNRTRYMEKNESYIYNMKAYNNSSNNINKATLYYVLPYNGDSSYEDLQSKFNATGFKVKLSELPSDYKAYYSTGGVSANIISNELNPTSGESNSWVEWNNPTVEVTGVNAIKIEKIGSFDRGAYFLSNQGINVEVTPEGSDVGDIYYNQFYIIAETDRKTSYPSSRNEVSIYNRGISGFVWEDYDYDGLYSEEESKLENIPVSLYRISDDIGEYDRNDPSTFVGKDGEEWISDTTTDSTGSYKFTGLSEGNYYVKFSYSDKKYGVTKRDAKNPDGTQANAINSKARGYTGDVAISNTVVFDAVNNASFDSLNLGLNIKKEFAVDVNNYIKNVTITDAYGTKSYDYDKQSTVSISLRNTNNKTARVTYEFVLENTKYFPGYVGLIQDVMPAGFTFNSNIKENQDWVYAGGVLYYTGLSGKLLVPNEKYYFNLVLDYQITEGGNYINFVSLDNLVLMGDEVPEFEFNPDAPSETPTDDTNTGTDSGTNAGSGEGN